MADAKRGKSPMEDYYNSTSQSSRVVLAKPRLGGFGSSSFASSSNKSNNPFGSVLRPPQLKPTSNPFIKVTESVEKDAGKEKKNENKNENDKEKEKKEEMENNKDSLKDRDNKEKLEAHNFIPLGSASVTPRTNNSVTASVQPTTSSSAGFVFGQNLSERVFLNEKVNNGEASLVDHSSTNGATELLFTSAAASVKENIQDEAGPSEVNGSEGSLAAAAAEYERSHARPPPPTTNYTTTGEEGEINVLQISCRLFAWESGSWRERGRGVLRLNDAAEGGAGGVNAPAEGAGAARLVARVAGSLRVVLNTKLWAGMVVERAGAKSLRITAADAAQQIKLFLIMGAPGDINQLYRAVTARITLNKRANEGAQNSSSQQAAERLEASTDDSEYLDKANDDVYGAAEMMEKQAAAERLEVDPPQKTEEQETNVDDSNEEKKSLKRKEPVEDETSPKRQCPEILIE